LTPTTAAPLKTVEGAVNIAALKGPTAMGLVKYMDDVDSGKITDQKYNFQIAASPDLVTPLLVQGKLDIAAVPANLASVLYNNMKGGVEVLAINTLGVIYIVENGSTIKSAADLKGKTIYASGKGATPEYALNYILKGNGIDPARDVTIEWKSEHAECLNALMSNENAIAMLPEPFVTTAMMKSDKIHVALDLTKEWDKLQKDAANASAMLTGVVVVRKDFAEKNPDAVKKFMDHYKESVDFVNANTDAAAALIGKYDIVKTEVARKALPQCNITFIEGDEMKTKLSGYLSVLNDQNPKAIGGALPKDDFYYRR
jgi:NitT/TauT family transport system substrate-binding protein